MEDRVFDSARNQSVDECQTLALRAAGNQTVDEVKHAAHRHVPFTAGFDATTSRRHENAAQSGRIAFSDARPRSTLERARMMRGDPLMGDRI